MAIERYPKAYKNLEFLNSSEARTIRILSEYEEPLSRFKKLGVWDSVIFFGSARLQAPEDAKVALDEARKALETDSGNPDLAKAVKHAEVHARNSKYYADAMELSRLLSEWFKTLDNPNQFVVSSGGGPGIMEAANRGAKEADYKSIGLNISLPFEQYPNQYISEELNFEFHYFFMRKFWFVHPARAAVIFPGGFGTLDEMMEVLTLTQTEKLQNDMTIVLFGSDFWNKIINFQAMADELVISEDDLNLFKICDTPEEAFAHLKTELTEKVLNNG